jgi:hypothetical protein
MYDTKKPTQAQIDYAYDLMEQLGYEETDVPELTDGIEFDSLTRSQMARLIDGLRNELEG